MSNSKATSLLLCYSLNKFKEEMVRKSIVQSGLQTGLRGLQEVKNILLKNWTS